MSRSRLGSLRDTADLLRSRYVCASLDAVATAGLGASRRESGTPATAGGPRRYRRVQRAALALSRAVPGGYECIHRLLMRASRLPVAIGGAEVRLIGYGSGVTVFLVPGSAAGETGSRRVVIKVYRRTLGRRLEALLADARHRRATYRRVAGWYDGCSPLLPTQFLVGHGPLLALPGLLCLQHYVEPPHRDVFTGLSEQELAALASRSPRLGRQLVSFAERTSRAVVREGASVDLIGRDNLIVAGPDADPRLVLLEHGVHDLTRKEPRASAIAAETRRRLAYLHQVARQVQGASALGGRA